MQASGQHDNPSLDANELPDSLQKNIKKCPQKISLSIQPIVTKIIKIFFLFKAHKIQRKEEDRNELL